MLFETRPGAHFDDPCVPLIFALLFVSASARSFGWAARGALMPNLVPHRAFANAVTWNANLFQAASVMGPAIGGVLIARFGFPFVYAVDAMCALAFFFLLLPIRTPQQHDHNVSKGLHDLFSGVRFVWRTKLILATITLDLFAVLLGGATALLPMFADEILHVGPKGLGWLRAAPSFGAVVMGVLMARLPPMRGAGRTLLWAVASFGVVTVVFGLSKNFWLSMTMLAFTGAFDNVSVVVRHTLIQLLTPDPMRGRVSAVNNVFIGSSNELGAFESGLTAAWWGPVASVVVGGIGTILVVLAVVSRWPEVSRLKSLSSVKPERVVE
jgi:MFS family permease